MRFWDRWFRRGGRRLEAGDRAYHARVLECAESATVALQEAQRGYGVAQGALEAWGAWLRARYGLVDGEAVGADGEIVSAGGAGAVR